jgi:hypothetical protein
VSSELQLSAEGMLMNMMIEKITKKKQDDTNISFIYIKQIKGAQA